MNNLNQLKYYNLLYVEDNEHVRINIANTLKNFVSKVFTASDADEAIEIYLNNKIDILYTDIDMPGKNGLDLIKIIRDKNKSIPIIVLTAYKDSDYLLNAIAFKLEEYLIKPANYQTLKKSLEKCMLSLVDTNNSFLVFNNNTTYNLQNNTLISSEHKSIKLANKEKLLLKLLVENKNEITYYTDIEQYVWEGSSLNKGTLKARILKLRKKIGEETIITEHGLGYRLFIV